MKNYCSEILNDKLDYNSHRVNVPVVDIVKSKYIFGKINELNLEELEDFTKIKNHILCKAKYDKERLEFIYNRLRLRGKNERLGSNL